MHVSCAVLSARTATSVVDSCSRFVLKCILCGVTVCNQQCKTYVGVLRDERNMDEQETTAGAGSSTDRALFVDGGLVVDLAPWVQTMREEPRHLENAGFRYLEHRTVRRQRPESVP